MYIEVEVETEQVKRQRHRSIKLRAGRDDGDRMVC